MLFIYLLAIPSMGMLAVPPFIKRNPKIIAVPDTENPMVASDMKDVVDKKHVATIEDFETTSQLTNQSEWWDPNTFIPIANKYDDSK